ncbi:hypothetical protein HBI04_224540 [Parastagonospora nodorum]|nr:hypothetical protein HBI04_224540 [Parastagonospora nodorum]
MSHHSSGSVVCILSPCSASTSSALHLSLAFPAFSIIQTPIQAHGCDLGLLDLVPEIHLDTFHTGYKSTLTSLQRAALAIDGSHRPGK